MRLALVSLLAATLMGAPALAQTPTPPTAAPSVAAPAPTTTVAPAPMAPAPMAPDPAAPAPMAPAAPPAPVLPPPPEPVTDPLALQVIATLENVCIPATNGGDLNQIARAQGFRRTGGNTYTLNLRGVTYSVVIQPPPPGGRTCEVVFEYPVDTFTPVIVAVHQWALGRAMTLRDPFRTTSDLQRDVRSWERDADALVVVSEKKADGTPVGRNRQDRARMLFQRR